jgi:hypothetical protein
MKYLPLFFINYLPFGLFVEYNIAYNNPVKSALGRLVKYRCSAELKCVLVDRLA